MMPRVLVHLAGDAADALALELEQEGIAALVIGDALDCRRVLRSQGSVRILASCGPLPAALQEAATAQPRTVLLVEAPQDTLVQAISAALAADGS